LKCPDIFDDPFGYSGIPDDDAFSLLNEAYHKAVDYQYSSLPIEYTRSGFQVPIDVKFEPYLGRAVYATTHIQRGTLVYKYVNVAEFKSPHDYRNFLRLLPPRLACDVINWAYTFKGKADDDVESSIDGEEEDVDEDDNRDYIYRICVDLDEASLLNASPEGRSFLNNLSEVFGDDDEEDNIPTVSIKDNQNCPQKEFLCLQGEGLFAVRDILPGEEVRQPYEGKAKDCY
jgi:hypothetical protein